MSKKDRERSDLKNEKNDFFPFVHGEQVESHRQNINSMMRNDYQNYLSARERDLSNSNKSTIV